MTFFFIFILFLAFFLMFKSLFVFFSGQLHQLPGFTDNNFIVIGHQSEMEQSLDDLHIEWRKIDNEQNYEQSKFRIKIDSWTWTWTD